ncbi:invasion associated locus B family protein [Maliponia aquimaris]|uniref:Invasion associated locus B (IalB) protein n=1 Tax=Maliponia aquimaris TaxID=1673631 RepID=A0A238L966_9RHOB|nr:invasion associated locus B family protein [Maliponia aquimaris]SMX50856.1 Invasion associated locus B (IalB) protein [Maliponia aquimaris]
MKKPLILLSLIAALAAGAVQAQTAEGDAPAAPAADTGLDLGTPAAPAIPEPYVKEVFTDWELRCLKVDDTREICQMYQLLDDGQGASVAEVNLFRLKGGGQAIAGGTFTVPLETLLTQKLSISVDGREAKRYDFSFCTVQGCFARVGFTAEDITRFKAGKIAEITIVPVVAPDQKVTVAMSLAGFTAAFDASSELSP